ncbi:MAG: hypothetical protein ACOYOO_00620 [Saprospiraceae bacterium]|jgi:hypothetical protein
MKISFALAVCCVILSASCTGQGRQGNKNSTPDIPEPTGEQIRELGRLKQVEDSGYPFFTLLIEFPERQFEESFLLDLSEVTTLDPGTLNKAVGSYVRFNYTSNIINALMDMRQEGRSLMGINPEDLPEGLERATGILTGATSPTEGDLPSRISVNDPHEFSLEFETFVTPEMVEAESNIVEVFFDKRTENKIAAIKVMPK